MTASSDDSKPLAQPHDRLARQVFESPEALIDELTVALPKDVTDSVNLKEAKSIQGTFIDEFERKETDLLIEMPYHGNTGQYAYAYFLVEHQSTIDPEMPVRVLTYIYRAWQHLIAQGRAKWSDLPVIIPLVYYHGDTKWQTPMTIADCLNPQGRHLAKYCPSLTLTIDDITHSDHDRIWTRHTTPVMRVVTATLSQRADINQMLEVLASMAQDIMNMTGRDQTLIAMYLKDQMGADSFDDLKTKIREQNPQLENIMTSYMQEAIDTFRHEGELKGTRRSLTRQLKAKFGSITPTHLQRINTATSEQLETWLETILTANAPDEIFT